MAHPHRLSHLVRRQRHRDDDEVATVVSVKVVTMANTFTGKVVWVTQGPVPSEAPKTLIAPAERSQPATSAAGTTKPTSAAAIATTIATSRKPSATPGSDKDDRTSLNQASTLMVATRPPTFAAASTVAVSATAAVATSAADNADAGMSTGAKASLVLGLLLAIGALLVGILVLYRRKKNQAAVGKDNEKIDLDDAPPPPPPQVQAAAAPSSRSQRTLSTAPRLSLRPVTQFDPAFDARKSQGNLLGAMAAIPASQPQTRDLAPSPEPVSSWEKLGASHAPAVDPFKDPELPVPASVNPFGNDAAVDPSQSRIPDSPPNGLAPAQPGSVPMPTAPAAEIDPVMAAAAMASTPPAQDLSAPPSLHSSVAMPPSPAWTDDLPASPGPAPAGPLPVAGAAIGNRSNSPAPSSGPNNVHRVQLDFNPSMQDELELRAGGLVRMLHEYDDGWALCVRMDRSQQGVVPRTCLSKHPVKPRNGPPRGPPPAMRGPPPRPMGPGSNIPQPRPLSPAGGRNSPAMGGPDPRSMSPGPHMQGAPRGRSNSNAPYPGAMGPPPPMGRPRSNSANQAGAARRGPAPGPSPMNPNAALAPQQQQPQDQQPTVARKPVPGMAM